MTWRVPVAVMAVAVTWACSETPVEPGEPPGLTWVFMAPEEQGILSVVGVIIQATTADGEPVPDLEIEFRPVRGGGHVGRWAVPGSEADWSQHVVLHTDSTGEAGTQWRLGPNVGEQEIQASIMVPGGAWIRRTVTATPGMVAVGVWDRVSEERRETLPSDTFRVHASNRLYLDPALEAFHAGEERWISGTARPGPGLDTAYVFHLDAAFTQFHPPYATIDYCVRPTADEAELMYDLGHSQFHQLCPMTLRLIDFEPVPEWYLDLLAAGAP